MIFLYICTIQRVGFEMSAYKDPCGLFDYGAVMTISSLSLMAASFVGSGWGPCGVTCRSQPLAATFHGVVTGN